MNVLVLFVTICNHGELSRSLLLSDLRESYFLSSDQCLSLAIAYYIQLDMLQNNQKIRVHCKICYETTIVIYFNISMNVNMFFFCSANL